MGAEESDRTGRRRGIAAAATAVLMLALSVGGPAWAQGDPLIGLDGQELSPRDLNRGLALLVFWTTWSPRGRDIVQRVNALEDRWGDRARVLSVNFQEDPSKVRAFLASREELRVPVMLDQSGDFSKNHRVSSAPWLLVLKDGVTVFSGKLSRDPDQVIRQASQ